MPGWGSAWKNPSTRDHLQNDVGAACGKDRSIEARRIDGREVIATNALDVLLHVHHRARPFPVHLRDKDVGICGKVAGESFRVPPFHGEVELALE